MAEKETGKRLALIVASYEFQDDTLQQLVAPALRPAGDGQDRCQSHQPPWG